MKEQLIKTILMADKNHLINLEQEVKDVINDEVTDIRINSQEECMKYIPSMDEEDFICLILNILGKIKNLNGEEEEAVEKTIHLLLH